MKLLLFVTVALLALAGGSWWDGGDRAEAGTTQFVSVEEDNVEVYENSLASYEYAWACIVMFDYDSIQETGQDDLKISNSYTSGNPTTHVDIHMFSTGADDEEENNSTCVDLWTTAPTFPSRGRGWRVFLDGQQEDGNLGLQGSNWTGAVDITNYAQYVYQFGKVRVMVERGTFGTFVNAIAAFTPPARKAGPGYIGGNNCDRGTVDCPFYSPAGFSDGGDRASGKIPVLNPFGTPPIGDGGSYYCGPGYPGPYVAYLWGNLVVCYYGQGPGGGFFTPQYGWLLGCDYPWRYCYAWR